jgi:hypothetical protein
MPTTWASWLTCAVCWARGPADPTSKNDLTENASKPDTLRTVVHNKRPIEPALWEPARRVNLLHGNGQVVVIVDHAIVEQTVVINVGPSTLHRQGYVCAVAE